LLDCIDLHLEVQAVSPDVLSRALPSATLAPVRD
jgi:hypothetical protein